MLRPLADVAGMTALAARLLLGEGSRAKYQRTCLRLLGLTFNSALTEQCRQALPYKYFKERAMSFPGVTNISTVLVYFFFAFPYMCMPAAAATNTTPSNASPSLETLPRRPFLGVNAEPAPNNHVRVGRIIPNSSAAQSALAVGDILVSLNGTPVDSVSAFLAGVKSFKSGDHLVYRVQRDGREMDIDVTLSEWPREKPGDIQVLYDAVVTPEATVRSILTMPIGNTRKLPSILFVQGFDCGSVDWPFPEPHPARELLYSLTRAGFAVMRSEKSGVGDSAGTPCRDVDFRSEVSLFTSALKKLKSYDFVDTEQVFIFGYSAGGWIAPLVASKSRSKASWRMAR